MDSNLRKKNILEIVKAQKESLYGPNTSEEDIIDIGYVIVHKIPLSLLEVNIDDGRFASLSKLNKTKIDYSSDEGKQALLDLYWNSSHSDRNNILLESIKSHGQKIPGIITNDGVIIDGNRRFMALQKLSKKDSLYFKAYIADPDTDSRSATNFILPQDYFNQKRSKYIYSSALHDFSENQSMFPDAFTNIKFSLMCDMYALNKDKNKTLRFGDFKFNEKHSQTSDPLDNYSFPSLYEFNTLNKLTFIKLNSSFFNSNDTIKTLSKEESKFKALTSEILKLDGVFIDLTEVSSRYFERDQEAKEFPLSSINLINNTNGIVAIKASEMFMSKAINKNNEDYQKSPWEVFLNNSGYFMQAVFKPNPFQSRVFKRESIFVFTKRKNNNEIIIASIGTISDNWKKPLNELSEIIRGKKPKSTSKLTINKEKFYSFSNLTVLREIESFPPPFNNYTKVKLKDIATSITKVSRSEQAEKATSQFLKDPQNLGKLMRDISSNVAIKLNIENSFVISGGKWHMYGFQDLEDTLKDEIHSANQASNIEFKNPSVVTANEAIIDVVKKSMQYLPQKQNFSSGFHCYEVILKKSLKSEYFAIFIKSALGQLAASSIHRWGLIGNLNTRIPRLTKNSLGEMTVIYPNLEIQNQVIDAHKKIQQLNSSIGEYNKTLNIDPSLIISETIGNINEMLNLVGKLTDEERVKLMIQKMESDTNEFKQTWRLPMAELQEWQNFTEESNKIKFVVMKVIASYLNANGGELLIGYSEVSHQIEGLEGEFNYFDPGEDIKTQKDHFNTKFEHTLSSTFEDYFQQFISPRFVTNDNKIVYFISCKKADRPCYIKGNKAKKVLGSEFYRRKGDSSDPLEGKELVEYIFNQWPDYRK